MGDVRFRLNADGRMSTSSGPARVLEEGEYRLDCGPDGTYLVSRHGAEPDTRTRVWMAGELATRMRVVEILNIVTSAQWSGELHVIAADSTRVLTIGQGALKHARTTVESERIGEQLVRGGLLERSALAKLLLQKSADLRFGQLLVKRGLLGEELLFKQLQQQTEAIFYAAMLVESGTYWFVSAPEREALAATTVLLPIQGLLMEGVQRVDELALFRERIPHNRLYPRCSEGAHRDGLDAAALALLPLCDGTRSIDDLSRASSLGEFATIKLVYQLLREGRVALRKAPALDPAAVRRMVRKYNDIARDIFVAIATYGSMERTSRAIGDWLANGPHCRVVGERVDIDGTLDAQEILTRLVRDGSEDPQQELSRALHELAAYALFLAANGLPQPEERALARDVNVRLAQLQ